MAQKSAHFPAAASFPAGVLVTLTQGDAMPVMHVQRSIDIHAPADRVFGWVADYSTWTQWSPWLCSEPEAKVSVNNPREVGGTYAWAGTVVGAGEMEHLELVPGSRIVDELRFIKPYQSVNKTAFELIPQGDNTRLTWTMSGPIPWFLFWMKGQLEGFIGMDFDRGLQMLKELIEAGHVSSKLTVHGKTQVGPLSMLGVRGQCAIQDVGPSMEQALEETRQKMERAGLSLGEVAMSVYHKLDVKQQRFDYTSGYMVADLPTSTPNGLSTWSIPDTNAFRVDHHGSYTHLGNAWSVANQLTRYHKMKFCKHHPFELYRVAGADMTPAGLVTEVYLPLK